MFILAVLELEVVEDHADLLAGFVDRDAAYQCLHQPDSVTRGPHLPDVGEVLERAPLPADIAAAVKITNLSASLMPVPLCGRCLH